jgi:hypothetical protein
MYYSKRNVLIVLDTNFHANFFHSSKLVCLIRSFSHRRVDLQFRGSHTTGLINPAVDSYFEVSITGCSGKQAGVMHL